MFVYRITFLGGSQTEFRANSPKEAWNLASEKFELEVIAVKYLRGK